MPNKAKKPYTKDALEKAVKKVKKEAWSLRRAAREFEVPRATLFDYVRGKYKQHDTKIGAGAKLDLDQDTEQTIVSYLKFMAQSGFPLTRKLLKIIVHQTVVKMGVKTRFGSSGPSSQWVRNFLKRHSELSVRTPDPLDNARSSLTQEDIERYFDLLSQQLDLHKFNPSQIWNLDETGFSSKDKIHTKVIATKGTKSPYLRHVKIQGHNTVLVAANAEGTVLPPLVIFQQSTPSVVSAGVPQNWVLTATKSGWINTEIFYHWFRDVFIPLTHRHSPNLLIMDNHASHLNTNVIELATVNKVSILCLPPHSSHMLQPLDKVYFGVLKRTFASQAVSFGLTGQRTLNHNTFLKVLQFSMGKISAGTVRSAFQATGIVPFRKLSITGNQQQQHQPTVHEIDSTSAGNPLVKLGIIPECLADVLVPPPKIKPVFKRRKLQARILTPVHVLQQPPTAPPPEPTPEITKAKKKKFVTPLKTASKDRCTYCKKDDTTDDWIGCDGCPQWLHYSCLPSHLRPEVDLSIVCKSKWYCEKCKSEPEE